MSTQKIDTYKRLQIETADQKTLIVMLYDKAISLLEETRRGLEAKDYERKGNALNKAKDIVFELLSALDLEKGGEIAERLQLLYDYVIKELIELDTTKNLESLDNAKRVLSELREAWKDIDSNPDTEAQYAETDKVNVDLCG